MRAARTIAGVLVLVAIAIGLALRLAISSAAPVVLDPPPARTLRAGDLPALPALPFTEGFAAATPPHNGCWHARLRGIDNPGFTGFTADREWDLSTRCDHGRPCTFNLTRFVVGDTPDSAPLRRTAGGWMADYDTTARCGTFRGSPVRWRLQMHVRLRFSRDGRRLVGAESEQAAGACGHARGTRVWIGTRL